MSSESPAAPVKAPEAGVVVKTDADLQEKNKEESTEPEEDIGIEFESAYEKADLGRVLDGEDEDDDEDDDKVEER